MTEPSDVEKAKAYLETGLVYNPFQQTYFNPQTGQTYTQPVSQTTPLVSGGGQLFSTAYPTTGYYQSYYNSATGRWETYYVPPSPQPTPVQQAQTYLETGQVYQPFKEEYITPAKTVQISPAQQIMMKPQEFSVQEFGKWLGQKAAFQMMYGMTPTEYITTRGEFLFQQQYWKSQYERMPEWQKTITRMTMPFTPLGGEWIASHLPIGATKTPEEYVMQQFTEFKMKKPTYPEWMFESFTRSPAGLVATAAASSYLLGGVISEVSMASPKFAQASQLLGEIFGKKLLYAGIMTTTIKAGIQEVIGVPREQTVGGIIKEVSAIGGAKLGFEIGMQEGLPITAGRFKIPTAEGEVTKYTGIYGKWGEEAHPLIGVSEGKLVLGTPDVDISDIYLAGGWKPTTLLTSTLTRRGLGQIYPEEEVLKITTTLGKFYSAEEITPEYIHEKILTAEHFKQPEKAREVILEWAKDWNKQVQQFYGSSTAYAQMSPEALMERGIPIHDYDVMLKTQADLSQKMTKDLLERLSGIGEKVWTTTKQPLLIQTPKGHAVDIHDIENVLSDLYKYAEGSWGITYEQPPVKVGELKVMSIGEFAQRKGGSILTLYPEGARPELHRMKDITDFLISLKYAGGEDVTELAKMWGVTTEQMAKTSISIPFISRTSPTYPSIPIIPFFPSISVPSPKPSYPIVSMPSQPSKPSVSKVSYPISVSPPSPSRPSVSSVSISVSPSMSPSISPSASISVSPSISPPSSIPSVPSSPPSPPSYPSVSPPPPSPPSKISYPSSYTQPSRKIKPSMMRIRVRSPKRQVYGVVPRAGLLSQAVEMTGSIKRGKWRLPKHPKATRAEQKRFAEELFTKMGGMEYPTAGMIAKGRRLKAETGMPSVKHIMPELKKRRGK